MIAARIKRVKNKLKNYLYPYYLEIIDESHLHSTHKNFVNLANNEATHIKIIIASEKLEAVSRVKQHRIIYDLLQEELNNGLHALSINVIGKAS